MPTKPPGTPTVDVSDNGDSGAIGNAVFMTGLLSAAPSGQSFSSFVGIQRSGSEQGYNSDHSAQFDEKPNANSVLLADVPTVVGDGTNGTEEGVIYREFLFNLNEPNAQNKPYLSLDALQIWQEESGNLGNFTAGSGFAGAHTNYLAYNLDAGGDHWVGLTDGISHGSGQGEYRVLIRDDSFVNDAAHRYVSVYSQFGLQSGWDSGGGFEEWGLAGASGGSKSAIALTKTAAVPGGTADHAGEVITYTYHIDNTGNTDQTGVTLTDPSVSDLTRNADIVGNNDNVLNVGEVWSYTAHHTVTQQDLDSNGGGDGTIDNTATADTAQVTPVSATASVTVVQTPTLEMHKTPDVTSVHAAGDVIHYSITVENIGTNTLSQLTVTDPQVTHSTPIVDTSAPIPNSNAQILVQLIDGDNNLGDTNQNNVRDPGETWQYAYIGDTNQDGFHDPGETWTAFNLGDTNNDGIHQVGETWVGDTNQNGIQEAGEKWQFKNVGDTNHNGLQDPGETWHYQNVGDINDNGTQDLGETFLYYNAGDTNQNNNPDSGETFQYYNVGDTNHNGVEDSGETFQFDVNHNADGVDANHDGFNDGDTNQNGNLDVGETWQFTVNYTVTQSDIDNGGVVDPLLTHDNTSSATTDQGATGDATAQVSIVQNPHVTLTKTATVADGTADAAGDVINYAIDVANDGNMTLTSPVVSDPAVSNLALASGDTNSNGKIDVGETWHYTANHNVTQSDIDNGGVVNPALTYDNTASVSTHEGASASDSASVPIVQDPDLTIVKSADVSSVDAAGDMINYTVTVANAGNMTLTGLTVTDPLVTNLAYVSGDANSNGKLDLTETWTYTGSHTVTQPEMDAGGTINNTATADTVQTSPESASASVTVQQNPAMTLDKIGTFADDNHDGYAEVGEHINYTFTIANTGNVTLHNVSVSDADAGVSVSGSSIASLGPAASDSTTWTASYAITQNDINNGSFVNTASAAATEASATDSATVTLPAPPPTAGISIDDNNHLSQLSDPGGDGPSIGDPIQFFFQITNLGNTTLTNVAVSDTLNDAVAGSLQTAVPTTLAGNAMFGDTFNHFLTAADFTSPGHIQVVDDITVTALDFTSATQTATYHYDFHL